MTRAKDISKIVTDADLSGTLDVTGTVTAGGLTVSGTGVVGTLSSSNNNTVLRVKGNGATNGGAIGSTSSDDLVLLSGLTERVRIDSSGNVGIGTTSPNAKTEITTSSGENLRLTKATGAYLGFHDGTTTRAALQGINGADGLSIHTGSSVTERMRIDNSGNVGIGTTSPSSQLHLAETTSNTTTRSDQVQITASSSGTTGVGFGTNIRFVGERNGGTLQTMGRIGFEASTNTTSNLSSDFIVETAASGVPSERVRIDSSGNVGIGVTPSRKLHVGGTGSGQGELHLTNDTTGHGLGDGSTFTTSGSDLLILQRENATTRFYTNGTEHMRITSGGNVGIGATSFNPKLYVVNNSSGPFLTAANATAVFHGSVDVGKGGCIGFDFGASHTNYPVGMGYLIESQTGLTKGSLVFGTRSVTTDTAPTERMRIDSSGNLFVGCTGLPSGGGGGAGFEAGQTNGRTILQLGTTTTSQITVQRFYNPNGNVGEIKLSGSSTIYSTSSDHRLKENVTADWDATTRLKQLNPVRFNFIADADTIVDGFLAHEVQSVVPEAITGTHNEVDDDGNPVYQGIDQSKLVPLLVKTIQELEARILALETA